MINFNIIISDGMPSNMCYVKCMLNGKEWFHKDEIPDLIEQLEANLYELKVIIND